MDKWLKAYAESEMEVDRRDASYELKRMSASPPYLSALSSRLDDLFHSLQKERDEDIVQTLVEILHDLVRQQEPHDSAAYSSRSQNQSLTWLQNSTSIVADQSRFETLLNLLSLPHVLIRVSVIELLITLWDNAREAMEAAMISVPRGMQCLVDVLDADREEVRNVMLILLLQLTEENEDLQNFLAFSDGFSKLFQIILADIRVDIIVQDCLTIMDNMLRGNSNTQKMLGMSAEIRHLAQVLAFANDDTPLSPAKRQSVHLALSIISHLVSGSAPDAFAQEFATAKSVSAKDNNTNLVLSRQQKRRHEDAAGTALTEEIRRRHVAQLREMQKQVGRRREVFAAVAGLVLSLHVDGTEDLGHDGAGDEEAGGEESKSLSELRQEALILLGDLVCGNAENGAELMRMSKEVPSDAAVVVFRPLVEGGDAGKMVQFNAVSGAVVLALSADLYEERVSAEYLFACLLHENPDLQVAIVGHAITPPPDDYSDNTEVLRAPDAGHLLINTFMESLSAVAEENEDDAVDGGDQGDDEDEELADVAAENWTCGRMLERVIRGNDTSKDMLLHISQPQAFFPTLLYNLANAITRMAHCKAEHRRMVVKAAVVSGLRVTAQLVAASPVASIQLAQSAGSLFLYSNAKQCSDISQRRDGDVEGLCAFVLGHCLISLWEEGSTSARESLGQLMRTVIKVIGLEDFTDRLSRLSKSDAFKLGKKSKNALLREDNLCDPVRDGMYYENAFVESFEATLPVIQKSVIEVYTETNGGRRALAKEEEEDNEVQAELGQEEMTVDALKARCDALAQEARQYKLLIREQDRRIAELTVDTQRPEKPALLDLINASDLSSEDFLQLLKQTRYSSIVDSPAQPVQHGVAQEKGMNEHVKHRDPVRAGEEVNGGGPSELPIVQPMRKTDEGERKSLGSACKQVLAALLTDAAELNTLSSKHDRSEGLGAAVLYLIRLVEIRKVTDAATLLELVDQALDVCLCLEQLDEANAVVDVLQRTLQSQSSADPSHDRFHDKMAYVKERHALQVDQGKENQNRSNGSVNASEHNDSSLMEEHAQLLLLLANQEAAKNLLLETIQNLGGEPALLAAQTELGKLLASTL